MAAYGENYTQTCIQLLLNNGNGTFREASDRLPPQNWTPGSYLHEVVAMDLNGDGWMDFIAHGNANAESRIYLNTGEGHFVEATDLLPMKSGSFFSIVPGDVDNDGKQDLLVAAETPDGKGGLYLLRQLKPFDPALLFAAPAPGRHRSTRH